jgi:RNA polymerase sigma factor (sigma-70 family)
MPSSEPKLAAAQLRLELGARFSGPLMKFFLRRLKDRSQAEDLTQEVFLKVIRASESEAIENAEKYVFTAAANLLHDHRRRILRNPILTCQNIEDALVEEFNSALVDDRSPERVALGAATLNEVSQAFEELNELTRHSFEKAPPFVSGQPLTTDTATYDIIGRTYYAGFKAKF